MSRIVAAGLTVSFAALVGAAPAGAAAYLADQWGLAVVGAPAAWQYGTGSGVRIGIVDTGVDFAQEDLTGKIVASQNFLSPADFQMDPSCSAPNTPGQDDNGHGTHVAGIAAASGAVGVEGVAPSASLVVAKVLDCQGGGQSQDIANGINWAVANGAKVINLSLGNAPIAGIDPSQIQGSAFGTALQNAWNAGAIPVVAGGNNGGGILGLGNANYQGIPAVVVAATGSPYDSPPETDQLACYSNQVDQAQWGVAAPGGDNVTGGCPSPSTPTCGQYDKYEILSTYWTSANPTSCYATDEGTSMAAPFVSGTLADLLGRGLTPSQAVQTLLNTANHSVACGSVCSGLVNVAAAMQSVGPAGHPAASAAPAAAAPATRPSPAAAPSHPTTSSTSGPTTSTSTSPTTSSPHKTTSLGFPGRIKSNAHGSTWWLVLPILVGLGAASALGFVGRRRLAWRRADTQPGVPGDPPGPAPSG